MSQQNKVKGTYKKKGNVVILSQTSDDFELSPASVLNNIDANSGEINKTKDNIANAEATIVNGNRKIVQLKETVKQLKQFEDWAITIQESKLKAIIDEIKKEIYERVENNYKHDPTMTDRENNLQKFHQYRQYIATHKIISDEISPRIYKKLLFEECILENPWK